MKCKFLITILVLTLAFGFVALANILIPNDPLFLNLWNEDKPEGPNWGYEMIKLPSAWSLTTGVYPIAIVDSGFDIMHEDLSSNINLALSDSFDFLRNKHKDKNSHGTHVSGIIGSKGNNSIGIMGVEWNANLRLYNYTFPTSTSILKPERTATSLSIVTMINSAINKGAKIINLSAGYCLETNSICALTANKAKSEDLDTFDKFIELVDKLAKQKGRDVLFVFAAGNNKDKLDTASPARISLKLNNIISVANIKQDGSLSYLSNYGTSTVAAPGDKIFSTVPKGSDVDLEPCYEPEGVKDGYGCMSGTSMAAPFVSGLAGLIWSRAEELRKTLTAAEVKDKIVEGAKRGNKYAIDPEDGHKIYIINAYESLKLLEPGPPPPPPTTAAAWPMFGHNATRSGQSEYAGPQTNNIKW
ncbi:S8 family serine peptidase, partial [Patescibacteria group bacterium]|nr:S8 family serine peptidase [Patescibacteria group bacterium]